MRRVRVHTGHTEDCLRSRELVLLIHFLFKMLNSIHFLVFLLASGAVNVQDSQWWTKPQGKCVFVLVAILLVKI